MNANFETPITPPPPEPQKKNTTLIIVIVAVVLCCCCLGALGLAWTFGDQLTQYMSLGGY